MAEKCNAGAGRSSANISREKLERRISFLGRMETAGRVVAASGLVVSAIGFAGCTVGMVFTKDNTTSNLMQIIRQDQTHLRGLEMRSLPDFRTLLHSNDLSQTVAIAPAINKLNHDQAALQASITDLEGAYTRELTRLESTPEGKDYETRLQRHTNPTGTAALAGLVVGLLGAAGATRSGMAKIKAERALNKIIQEEDGSPVVIPDLLRRLDERSRP